jgi:hypothetical protein
MTKSRITAVLSSHKTTLYGTELSKQLSICWYRLLAVSKLHPAINVSELHIGHEFWYNRLVL